MALTPNYDDSSLAPKILIHDIDGTLQYTYESAQIVASSPTQDFMVAGAALHIGVNDDFGSFAFLISDPNNNLTDTDSRATSLIKQQWSVQLSLGKSSSSLNRWFYGKIIEVEVLRPKTSLQQIRVNCVGWATKTRYRMTNLKRFQKKTSDGMTLDATDTLVKISELAKDIVQDDDHFIDQGLTTESEITVNGVADIDIKLADFQLTPQSWFNGLSQLAAFSNSYWGLDGDRDLFMIPIGSADSGFLFTNNLAGLDAQGWDENKIGYLRNSQFSWTDTTYEGGISILHGLGANIITLDTEINPTPDSLLNFNSSWVAFQFVPNEQNLQKISTSLIRTGTPASGEATIFIMGDDGTGKPNGDDIRAVGTIGQSRLQALPLLGPNWVEVGFNIIGGASVTPRENLYVVFKKYGTASHTYNAETDFSIGVGNYWTSGTGASWTLQTGHTPMLRTYANNQVNVEVEDLATRRKYGTREIVFSFRQNNQEETVREALLQASEVLNKERRTYSNVVVSPMTDRLPIGKYCRVQDAKSGLDIQADIIGIDLTMDATNDTNVGAKEITLTLQENHS